MTENEIVRLLEMWQIHQHCGEEEQYLKIEKRLLESAGLDMEHDWENILKSRGLIL